MNKYHKGYTREEVFKILASQERNSVLAKELGRTTQGIESIRGNYRDFITGRTKWIPKKQMKFFKEYVNETTIEMIKEDTNHDVYENLQNAIIDVVAHEMRQKEVDIKKKYDEKIKTLEQDKQDLQETLRENAKKSNLAYMIRQRLGGA